MGKLSQASQRKKTGSAMFMTLQKWNVRFFSFFHSASSEGCKNKGKLTSCTTAGV